MFQEFLVRPIYNGFMYLIGVMPQGDVGLAIIILTIIIRVVFYPAFASSIRTQMGMQAAQPEIDEINKKYKDKPEERARRTMELFKKRGIKPFSGILALLVQLPVFFALYIALFRENLPEVATDLLYSFVPAPDVISVNFFGIMNLLDPHNLILAVLVGILQYFVARLSLSRIRTDSIAPERMTAHRMQRHMMLYFLPGLMAILAYTFPSAVGLYFAAGNLISLGQEWLIKRQLKKQNFQSV